MSYLITKADRQVFFEIAAYIKTNPAQKLTIRLLCKRTSMNAEKLGGGFAEIFKLTPRQFIIKYRMQYAVLLLKETEKPIKEIAALTGYLNTKSFHRAFKKFHRVTPLATRKC
jgi:AraC-like DNA-binding protein